MKMGRRLDGGGEGGRLPSIFKRVLRRRIESCPDKYGDIDHLIEYLRATFPEYGRHKLRPFAKHVEHTLENIKTTTRKRAGNLDCSPAPNFGNNSGDDSILFQSPARKKMRNTMTREKKLQHLETKHILRKQKHQDHCSPSPSSSSVSMPSSLSNEAEYGAVSSSEDAIYAEKFNPEFDLTKSMLREAYGGSNNAPKQKVKKIVEEKNVELEDVGKTGKLPAMPMNGLNEVVKDSGDRVAKVSKNSDHFQRKGGPMFKDLGGITKVLQELEMDVLYPFYHPQLLQKIGVKPLSGILLHGPPGCGKTRLAHAIANETGLPFHKISATELVSGISGASEENIRELFAKAYRTAPSIVFIDEIDAIASKRENMQREMERRIVTQLITCMDASHKPMQPVNHDNSKSYDYNPVHVLVIGATNRPDAIDPALRRPGRFDHEICLGIPDENARVDILVVLTHQLRLEGGFDLVKLARMTPGFVGADLVALTNKAGNLAIRRIAYERKLELCDELIDGEDMKVWLKHPWSEAEMEKLNITMTDFQEAVKFVQPSSRREGFSTIPDVKWEDVGGLEKWRNEFERYIVGRIKHPELYKEIRFNLQVGFLLYGPPGCGKTLIAKAVANEAGANFIHIKGPELLNKYVGESESAVRKVFDRARACSPCILFFDEVDALTTERGKEGGSVVERVVDQLLIELDGADQRQGVFVIGATNRFESIDPALLRNGRFGKHLFVPLPSPDARGSILRALCRKQRIDDAMDLIAFGKSEACEGFSGADLASLVDEAALIAVSEKRSLLQNTPEGTSFPLIIKECHFLQALKTIFVSD